MRVLVLLLFLVGCTRTIYTPIVSSRTIIDTIVEQTSDSTLFRALFECDSAGQVVIRELAQVKGRLANQSFDFSNNELAIKTAWKTKIIDRIIETRDTVTVVARERISEKVPFIPRFFWICFAVAMLAFGSIVVKAVKYFR